MQLNYHLESTVPHRSIVFPTTNITTTIRKRIETSMAYARIVEPPRDLAENLFDVNAAKNLYLAACHYHDAQQADDSFRCLNKFISLCRINETGLFFTDSLSGTGPLYRVTKKILDKNAHDIAPLFYATLARNSTFGSSPDGRLAYTYIGEWIKANRVSAVQTLESIAPNQRNPLYLALLACALADTEKDAVSELDQRFSAFYYFTLGGYNDSAISCLEAITQCPNGNQLIATELAKPKAEYQASNPQYYHLLSAFQPTLSVGSSRDTLFAQGTAERGDAAAAAAAATAATSPRVM